MEPRARSVSRIDPLSFRYALFHDPSPTSGKPRLWVIDDDGSNPRVLYDHPDRHPAHFVWLPGKDSVVTTIQPPNRGILRLDLDGQVSLVSDEEDFWHAGASADGTMLCSDTLTPDTGLHLVDPNKGLQRKLCLSNSSNSHPQWTHPHPTWSPDGRMVMFSSDMEGLPHVYLVTV